MFSVFQNCPLIQELEIMGTNTQTGIKSIPTEELIAIAQCVHLKRLTLSNLNVKDGRFLNVVYVYSHSFPIYKP